MLRRDLLIKQKGQRHLGEDGGAEYDYLMATSLSATELLFLLDSKSSKALSNHKGRKEDDSTSVISESTGLPSLVSINPSSITTGMSGCGSSVHSSSKSSGLGKFGSTVSLSTSSCDSYFQEQEAAKISRQIAGKQIIKVTMPQIQEIALPAVTVDCLQPTIPSRGASPVPREMIRWGGSSSHSDVILCHDDQIMQPSRSTPSAPATSSPNPRNGHALASRNADVLPTMPSRNGVFDSVPRLPTRKNSDNVKIPFEECSNNPEKQPLCRRRSTEDNNNTNPCCEPPPALYRRMSFDHIPTPPRRRGSFGRGMQGFVTA